MQISIVYIYISDCTYSWTKNNNVNVTSISKVNFYSVFIYIEIILSSNTKFLFILICAAHPVNISLKLNKSLKHAFKIKIFS